MSGLTLSEFWKEKKIARKKRCNKRNDKYEPLIISIGAVKKAEAVYELGDWFIYPTKGFVMNKKDTRKRMRINRFVKKINEGKMTITNSYNATLDEIEKNLKGIHYPLCDMEKYVFDYETDEINELVQKIHLGYMQIQDAVNKLRKLRGAK